MAFLGAPLLPHTFVRRARGRQPTSGQLLASCDQYLARRLLSNVSRKMKVKNFDLGLRNRALTGLKQYIIRKPVKLYIIPSHNLNFVQAIFLKIIYLSD